jgi:hypothetical protein
MAMKDELVEGRSPSGLIIVNHGDPAFQGGRREQGLPESEALFLRLIAYLTFADVVSIPSRFLLESETTSEAMVWSRRLLQEGLIAPERRADVGSFVDLATVRSLPEIAKRRGEYLDDVTKTHRSFRWDQLSSTYKAILDEDLGEGGAFRKTIKGGQKGVSAAQIDAAAREHLIIGDGTPEKFEAAFRRVAPSLSGPARRWAMARYYLTPTAFDTANTREIPSDAANLLTKGGVMDAHEPRFEFAAPAELLYAQLSADLPAHGVPLLHNQYCEALLEVRQQLPEARKVFSDINLRAHLGEVGESVSALMQEELAKQENVRPTRGRVYSIGAGLLGAAVGAPLALAFGGAPEVAAGIAFGGVTSLAANEVQKRRDKERERREKPWLLAIDQMMDRRPIK